MTMENEIDPLDALDADFQTAEAREEGEFSNVPPGSYHARLESVEIGKAKSDGNNDHYMTMKFIVTSGARKDDAIFKRHKLTTENGAAPNEKGNPYLKGILKKMGLEDLKSLRSLRQRKDEMVGLFAQLTVTHRVGNDGKTYPNIYIDKVVSAEEAGSEPVQPVKKPGSDSGAGGASHGVDIGGATASDPAKAIPF